MLDAGERTDSMDFVDCIAVDTSQIPEFRRRELVEPLHGLMTEFYADPKNQEKFEKWLQERNRRKRQAAGTEA